MRRTIFPAIATAVALAIALSGCGTSPVSNSAQPTPPPAVSAAPSDVVVSIVETYPSTAAVPGTSLTAVPTTKVTLKMTATNPITGKPGSVTSTVDAYMVGGQWRWSLTDEALKAAQAT